MNDELEFASRNLERSALRLRWYQQEREAEAKRRRRVGGRFVAVQSRNQGIVEDAVVRQRVGRAEFWATPTPMRAEWRRMQQRIDLPDSMRNIYNPDALNGYVAFPKRHAPRLPSGTGNIVQYIPVHGGITYAEKDSYAAVWGFDTMHGGSEKHPVGDKDWILANCFVLYRGLLLAAKFWPEWRRANQDRRAELAQQLLDLVEETGLKEKLGFEALLNTFFLGRIG